MRRAGRRRSAPARWPRGGPRCRLSPPTRAYLLLSRLEGYSPGYGWDGVRDPGWAQVRGRGPAQIALSWVTRRPGITATLIGATGLPSRHPEPVTAPAAVPGQQPG